MINGHRVAAIIVLHFGKDYLADAMCSVADVVDEYVIMYSPVASHGHASPVPCPETQQQLAEIALNTLQEIGRAGQWHTGTWNSEGDQFKDGMSRTDADVIVKLDADECWYPGLLQAVVEQGTERNVREMRVGLHHYWRSFRKAFTHDPAAPGRVYLRWIDSGESTFNKPADCPEAFTIHHFGYALPVELMRYKILSHGHKPQFRHDVDWLNEVYIANRQTDCHIVGSDYWMQTEDVEVPGFLRGHKFAGLQVIP